MKKQILLIGIILISMVSYAQVVTETQTAPQNEDAEKLKASLQMLNGAEVVMDVDTNLYPKSEGMSYFSEDEKAGIVPMVIPASFEKMKEDLAKQKDQPGVEILEQTVKEIGGKELLLLKQRVNREGIPYINMIFCERNTNESTILISTFYEESKEKTYAAAINEAVISARIKA